MIPVRTSAFFLVAALDPLRPRDILVADAFLFLIVFGPPPILCDLVQIGLLPLWAGRSYFYVILFLLPDRLTHSDPD